MRTIVARLIGVLGTVILLLVTAAAVPADAGGHDGGGSGGGTGHPGERCRRSLPTGVQTIQVRFDGTNYAVRLVVPAGAGGRTSLPLVLDLHGRSSNGVAQAPISDLTTLAAQEKFLVANPSGAIALAPQNPPLPDGSWAWNVPGVPTTAGEFPPADARR